MEKTIPAERVYDLIEDIINNTCLVYAAENISSKSAMEVITAMKNLEKSIARIIQSPYYNSVGDCKEVENDR